MGWIHGMGACMHVMDVWDGLCDEYMGWMHAMDVWDECGRGMHAMNGCMRWMHAMDVLIEVWDECMRWMLY